MVRLGDLVWAIGWICAEIEKEISMERRSFFGALFGGLVSGIYFLFFWKQRGPAIVITGDGASRGKRQRDGLESMARNTLRLIRKNVEVPASTHCDFSEEAASMGDTVTVCGIAVVLKDMYTGFLEDDGSHMGIAIWPLVEALNKALKSSPVFACRPLPAVPSGLGCQSVVASDGQFSIRLIRQYSHDHRGIEVTVEILYGTT